MMCVHLFCVCALCVIGAQAVQAGLPLDELSSRRTDYATGAKLAPLFGRKGKVSKRGNHHGLKVRVFSF